MSAGLAHYSDGVTESSRPAQAVVTVRGKVAPGNREELEQYYADAIPVLEGPGGIHVSVTWDDEVSFTQTTTYETKRDHSEDAERVRDSAMIKGFLERWRALLDDEPTVTEWFAADGLPTRTRQAAPIAEA